MDNGTVKQLAESMNVLKAQEQEIQNQIQKIQSECHHEFVLDGEVPEYTPTLIENTFITGRSAQSCGASFTLKCEKCELTLRCVPTTTCPKCHSKMRMSGMLVDLERFLGPVQDFEHRFYYMAREHYCSKCSFAFVVWEWNQ